MGSVGGFDTNEIATPVKYTEGTSDWGEPSTGSWQPIAGRSPVEVVVIDIPSAEKVRAGIDVATPAKTLYFNLTDGAAPFTERDTVEMDGVRWNIRMVVTYNVEGFERVGYCEVVKP